VNRDEFTIAVDLPGGRSDIRIGTGLLPLAGSVLRTLAPPGPVLLVTDTNVSEHYSDVVLDSLAAADFRPGIACIPAGEKSKSLPMVERIYRTLLDLGADRATPVVALGGGVITDLAGFAAATFLRGIPWIALPTTLLAQVDASVGGKTGVNLAEGKNLVGAFHHPRVVLADVDTLATLEEREFRSGLSEVAKIALSLDLDLLDLLTTMAVGPGPATPADDLIPLVTAGVTQKARIVMEDEREADLRRVLNFGHTAGHAIEAAGGYSGVLHGEAIAVGMVAALTMSVDRGLLKAAERDRALAALSSLGLPMSLADLPGRIDQKRLREYLTRDKKRRNGHLALVLLKAVGQAVIVEDGEPDEVLAAIPS